LQTGRIYVRQNPEDAQLSVDELRGIVGHNGENFSNRVLHYASSLRGTRQYWMQQRRRLISMIDDLGTPTIFFTHSAADFQWPGLGNLINLPAGGQRQAVIENPAIADWFFYHRIERFVQSFYVDILGASDYWFRFEWQHRGSPHIHGMAWLSGAPNAENIMALPDSAVGQREELIRYVDSLVSTWNPAVLPDGSNLQDIPCPRTDPQLCSIPYSEVTDHRQDLNDLISTCQSHTRCSSNYCLRNVNGEQVCHFGYPQPLQSHTSINTDNEQRDILTARNDMFINSYNPIQLSGWRANVDMKYITSREKVVEYCAKYATKCEPRSQSMREVFNSIVTSLKDGNTALTAIQKLFINSIGQRDFSPQETCHLLLQLPMFKASRDFVVLSLDGTHAVQQNVEEGECVTALSILDHYIACPSSHFFDSMTLLKFARSYSMPKEGKMLW